MKILLINNYHYIKGGADVVYLQTGNLLETKGNEVQYFSQLNNNNIATNSSKYFVKKTKYFDKSLSARIISIPRYIYSFEAKKKISEIINDFKPEIAHVHLYKGILTSSILHTLKARNIPVIISLHDYEMLCPHYSMLDGNMNICHRCITGSPLNCIIHNCNHNNLHYSILSTIEFIFHKTHSSFR